MEDKKEKEEVVQNPLYGTGYLDRYQKSQAALEAHNAKKPGDYQSKYQTAIDQAMAAIAERKPFQYSVNGDALYQQYKDRYSAMGKQAMQDAQGQAAAMTGGYGSSYGQQVGQQTYSQYMTALTDKIPELYQLALSKYDRDAQADKDRYSLYRDAENTDYGRYADMLSQWSSDRAYLAGRADTELGQAMTIAQQMEARLAALAKKGYKPTDDELRAVGYTREQWDKLYKKASSGGGSRMTGIPALDYGVGGPVGSGLSYSDAIAVAKEIADNVGTGSASEFLRDEGFDIPSYIDELKNMN